MNKANGVVQRTSGYRGRRRILDRAWEEDLLFRFEAGPAPDEQPLGAEAVEQPPGGEAEPSNERQQLLTLGGEAILVSVLPEPAGDAPDPFESAERAVAQVEETADQLRRGRDGRLALEQMYDLIHTCEAESQDAVQTEASPYSAAPAETPVGHGHASVDHATPAHADHATPAHADHATHATRTPTLIALTPGRRPAQRSRTRDARNRRTGCEPFHWRQFFVSAAVSSGLGAAALLIVYALGG